MKFPKTLQIYSSADIAPFMPLRKQEPILGETITFLDSSPSPRFALLGVPEDIGRRVQSGQNFFRDTWSLFLESFLNMYENQFLSGKDILLLGHVSCDDLYHEIESIPADDLIALNALVCEIDKRVTSIIQALALQNIIPLIIGGGQNNAYGCIKGTSQALQKPIQALNIDPCADIAPDTLRHNQNAFRFAFEEGFLQRYFAWGLHQEKNSQAMLNTIQKEQALTANFFDDLHKPGKHKQELQRTTLFFDPQVPLGLEIDLQSLALFPSSQPCGVGFSLAKINQYITHWSNQFFIPYFHVSENHLVEDAFQKSITAHTLASLVSTFIRSQVPRP